MTDNLLEAPVTPPEPNAEDTVTDAPAVPEIGVEGADVDSPAPASAPDGLPEKFWDTERGEIRTDSLVKSYQALEQKLGALAGRVTPDDPDGYNIQSDNDMFSSDPDVNTRLHAAGFSQEQAQTVYDLAGEYLSPMVSEVATEFQTQAEVDRLNRHFGTEEKWRETAQQIKSWGLTNFPGEVFQALSSTYDGVLAMHRMMTEDGNEPSLIENSDGSGESLSEAGLQQMMQNPKYWRDHDPAFVSKVHDGFKRLFPG
jgi:hypothetical protein